MRGRSSRLRHFPPPLDAIGSTPLFTDVDLLARPDKPNDYAPTGHAPSELDEVLGLGPTIPVLRMLLRNHRGIERPLCLVEDQHVLGWDQLPAAAIGGDVLLDAAHERLAAAARTFQLVLQDFNQRSVA